MCHFHDSHCDSGLIATHLLVISLDKLWNCKMGNTTCFSRRSVYTHLCPFFKREIGEVIWFWFFDTSHSLGPTYWFSVHIGLINTHLDMWKKRKFMFRFIITTVLLPGSGIAVFQCSACWWWSQTENERKSASCALVSSSGTTVFDEEGEDSLTYCSRHTQTSSAQRASDALFAGTTKRMFFINSTVYSGWKTRLESLWPLSHWLATTLTKKFIAGHDQQVLEHRVHHSWLRKGLHSCSIKNIRGYQWCGWSASGTPCLAIISVLLMFSSWETLCVSPGIEGRNCSVFLQCPPSSLNCKPYGFSSHPGWTGGGCGRLEEDAGVWGEEGRRAQGPTELCLF